MSPSDAALRVMFSVNRSWAEWSTIAVAVGLVIELLVVLAESRGRTLPHKIGLGLGTVVILVGVLGEYRYGGRSSDAAAELQRRSDQMVEKLRSANVELYAQIQPRRLLPAQEKELVALFKKFPGETVHVSSYMQDVDAEMLGKQILRATRHADLPRNSMLMEISSFGDVTIGLAITGTDADFVKSATALFLSFDLGPVSNKPVVRNFMNVDDEDAPFPLKIFVGAKPLPPSPIP